MKVVQERLRGKDWARHRLRRRATHRWHHGSSCLPYLHQGACVNDTRTIQAQVKSGQVCRRYRFMCAAILCFESCLRPITSHSPPLPASIPRLSPRSRAPALLHRACTSFGSRFTGNVTVTCMRCGPPGMPSALMGRRLQNRSAGHTPLASFGPRCAPSQKHSTCRRYWRTKHKRLSRWWQALYRRCDTDCMRRLPSHNHLTRQRDRPLLRVTSNIPPTDPLRVPTVDR